MSLTVMPNVLFNTSTGSDTVASGAGPGTAVTGTTAAHTGGVATTTITFTNSPNLSGVAQDGSAVLWLNTASGRMFTRISTVDNNAKTAVVEDSFNIGAGSAVNYAIGGKRNSFDVTSSRNLFTADMKAGWIITTETNQTISSVIIPTGVGDATNGPVTIQGLTGAIRVITESANDLHFQFNNGTIANFINLGFQNSNATKTSAIGMKLNSGGCALWIYGCQFGDPAGTNNLNSGIFNNSVSSVVLVNCEFAKIAGHGIDSNSNGTFVIDSCWFHDMSSSGDGILIEAATGQDTFLIQNCLITGNAGKGIEYSANGSAPVPIVIRNNTIHNNTSDGIKLTNGISIISVTILNNIITKNGGYGINANASADAFKFLIDYNCFGASSDSTNNTTAAYNNVTAGAHDLVGVSPSYANAAGNDFTPKNPSVKSVAFTGTGNIGLNSSSRSFVDTGAVQTPTAGVDTPTPVQLVGAQPVMIRL